MKPRSRQGQVGGVGTEIDLVRGCLPSGPPTQNRWGHHADRTARRLRLSGSQGNIQEAHLAQILETVQINRFQIRTWTG